MMTIITEHYDHDDVVDVTRNSCPGHEFYKSLLFLLHHKKHWHHNRHSLCSLNIKSSQPDDYVLSVVFVEASLTSQGVPHSA